MSTDRGWRRGSPIQSIPFIRRELRALNPRVPLSNPGTMQDVTDAALASTSFTMTMLGFGQASLGRGSEPCIARGPGDGRGSDERTGSPTFPRDRRRTEPYEPPRSVGFVI